MDGERSLAVKGAGNGALRHHRGRIRELFADGIEVPPAERAGWLRRQCEGLPPEVRDEVASLLAADDDASAGGFLRDPTVGPARLERSYRDASEPVPQDVRSYAVRGVLGRGPGRATLLAEQAGPLRRSVVITLLANPEGVPDFAARFDVGRRTLARLDHPNVARLVDAGTTEAGRPFLVTEWVDGPPLAEHAERSLLPVRDRLALFVDACRGVQHAHQKGVVHGDLGPGRVLVATPGGRPTPVVVGFGVHQPVAGADGSAERHTLTAARPFGGTSQPGGPERADRSAGPPDARADVYGLGVLLYELLTGVPPCDTKGVPESDPVPPSRRTLQAGRRRLSRNLAGDLDWIVARATERDPARRYPTADALAEDVGRHLAGRPVLAGPPSRVYRARKFAGRHPVLVPAAAAVAVLTLGGGIASTALWRDAARSRDRAEAARAAEASLRRAVEQDLAYAALRARREPAARADRPGADVAAAGLGGPARPAASRPAGS